MNIRMDKCTSQSKFKKLSTTIRSLIHVSPKTGVL